MSSIATDQTSAGTAKFSRLMHRSHFILRARHRCSINLGFEVDRRFPDAGRNTRDAFGFGCRYSDAGSPSGGVTNPVQVRGLV